VLTGRQGHEGVNGFSMQERQWIDSFLDLGFRDMFRYFYPESRKFTFWDQRRMMRESDRGWRIDYFLVSRGLWDDVKTSDILTNVRPFYNNDKKNKMKTDPNSKIRGSDHCPLTLEFNDAFNTRQSEMRFPTPPQELGAQKRKGKISSFFSAKPKTTMTKPKPAKKTTLPKKMTEEIVPTTSEEEHMEVPDLTNALYKRKASSDDEQDKPSAKKRNGGSS
jgi:hypothetical protein